MPTGMPPYVRPRFAGDQDELEIERTRPNNNRDNLMSNPMSFTSMRRQEIPSQDVLEIQEHGPLLSSTGNRDNLMSNPMSFTSMRRPEIPGQDVLEIDEHGPLLSSTGNRDNPMPTGMPPYVRPRFAGDQDELEIERTRPNNNRDNLMSNPMSFTAMRRQEIPSQDVLDIERTLPLLSNQPRNVPSDVSRTSSNNMSSNMRSILDRIENMQISGPKTSARTGARTGAQPNIFRGEDFCDQSVDFDISGNPVSPVSSVDPVKPLKLKACTDFDILAQAVGNLNVAETPETLLSLLTMNSTFLIELFIHGLSKEKTQTERVNMGILFMTQMWGNFHTIKDIMCVFDGVDELNELVTTKTVTVLDQYFKQFEHDLKTFNKASADLRKALVAEVGLVVDGMEYVSASTIRLPKSQANSNTTPLKPIQPNITPKSQLNSYLFDTRSSDQLL